MSVYVYSYNNEILYIGSTFVLYQRKVRHKSNLKCGNTVPFYKYLREQNLTFNDLQIEVIETAIYEKDPLKILERMMIEYWKPKCNYTIPGRTKNEWYIDNKEQKKQYYETNKERIREQRKKHY